MGTRRKVAVWYMRGPREYVVNVPGPTTQVDHVFPNRQMMLDAARAARLILKERPDPATQNHQTIFIPREEFYARED